MAEESDQAALRTLLAFVDGYELDSSTEVDNQDSAGVLTDHGSRGAPPERTAAKRAGYTTMLQRRKRNEARALREEVQELEAHLDGLVRGRNDRATEMMASSTDVRNKRRRSGEDNDRASMRTAVDAFKLRRHAEQENHKLRAVLGKEAALYESIAELLRRHVRHASLATESIVRPPPELASRQASRTNSYEAQLTAGQVCSPDEFGLSSDEVEREMHQLRRQSEQVFEPSTASAGPSLVSCSMDTKFDEAIGNYVEVRTTTPVRSSVANTGVLVRRKATLGREKYIWVFFRPYSDSLLNTFVLPLPRRDRHLDETMLLHVQHHSRKFDAQGRVLIVMLSLVRLPEVDVCLREVFWTLITPSSACPDRDSIIQTCYRVYVDRRTAIDQAATETTSFVMDELSVITRRNMLDAQEWLLQANRKGS